MNLLEKILQMQDKLTEEDKEKNKEVIELLTECYDTIHTQEYLDGLDGHFPIERKPQHFREF